MISVKVGETTLKAALAQNSTAEALKEMLADGPMKIDMRDFGNMEKVGGLGRDLPANDEYITTQPGDLILYQRSALVIYYESNTWNFTPVGKIVDVTKEELKAALGRDNVTVTLSLEA